MSRAAGTISIEQSGAFIESFLMPATADGPLAGLRFAVKDLIDIAGRPTGCGNPTWAATHAPAAVSAVCVEHLLAAGADCVGKTVTDELAFSLIGENHFYGTPLNPAAPDRVPGGSSSGSASAVACGLVGFALGTDTGGSVRVPASNCGIWGLRPTHGLVSVAGVMPFAPTFDAVGILAGSLDVLQRAAGVLLPGDEPNEPVPDTIHLLAEAFELADPDVREALDAPVACVRSLFGASVRETSLRELCSDPSAGDLSRWLDVYRVLMGVEVDSNHSAWIAASQPEFGPAAAAGFEFIRTLDRRRIGEASRRREHYCSRLRRSLGSRDLLCLPTSPTIAPLKRAGAHIRTGDYYQRTLALTAIAGIGRLPQVSMPVATASSAPIGLSFIGPQYGDLFLVEVARRVAGHLERD